ncbi:ImmA/IrrE family metallo-endopeptidase [Dactylosporangium sp. McL0621]|uniref:ImmA/IrrE family metallo-endopeptidase n=1 Tax=Dactylosporangium sp. McL0621 TaxID=3415678 RepID=UPI003CE67416
MAADESVTESAEAEAEAAPAVGDGSALYQGLCWDADGYFFWMAQRNTGQWSAAWPYLVPEGEKIPEYWEMMQALGIVHGSLRSALHVTMLATDEDREQFKQWSRLCLQIAREHAGALVRADHLAVPFWATIHDDSLKQAIGDEYAVARDVKVFANLEARLYARSYPGKREIHVSVLTREYLIKFNVLIWRYVWAVLEDRDNQALPELASAMLPHLLSLYLDANYSALPVNRSRDTAMFTRAHQTSTIQMRFIIAHEYAHIVLHGDSPNTPQEEAEADAFALGVVLRSEPAFPVEDVHTALSWLFGTLRLDAALGDALSGSSSNSRTAVIRRADVLSRLSAESIPAWDEAIESTGTAGLSLLNHQFSMLDWARVAAMRTQFLENFGLFEHL